MWTQQVIDKINNRSMNNVRSLLKVRSTDTRATFLLLTLKTFHATFGGLKWCYEKYLNKFLWLKLCSQYLLRCIYYVFDSKLKYLNIAKFIKILWKEVHVLKYNVWHYFCFTSRGAFRISRYEILKKTW